MNTPTDTLIANAKAQLEAASQPPFFGHGVYPIVTTDIDRAACLARADEIFEDLERQMPGIESLRVDTYTRTGHPVPGSDLTFDLYVKVIIVGPPRPDQMEAQAELERMKRERTATDSFLACIERDLAAARRELR